VGYNTDINNKNKKHLRKSNSRFIMKHFNATKELKSIQAVFTYGTFTTQNTLMWNLVKDLSAIIILHSEMDEEFPLLMMLSSTI